MTVFDDYTTECMERSMIALQSVRPFDYAGAMHAVMVGNSVQSVRSAAGLARLRGELLALDNWREQMTATLREREEARA
jgi:hypothetical protein